MFKPTTLLIVLILFLSGYWLYSNLNTPQSDSRVRVTNLPWQITVVDQETLRVFDMDLGRVRLGDAVKTLKSEYELAWFENPDQSISLEAYFLRVSMSGLRAKVILELETEGLEVQYLKKHSGKPEILTSRSIKYPVDDLAEIFSERMIRSLTYVPKTSVDAELLKQRFGTPEETMTINDDIEFWLYPQKGLVITVNHEGKEAFQYIPVADFSRLRSTVLATIEQASPATSAKNTD